MKLRDGDLRTIIDWALVAFCTEDGTGDDLNRLIDGWER